MIFLFMQVGDFREQPCHHPWASEDLPEYVPPTWLVVAPLSVHFLFLIKHQAESQCQFNCQMDMPWNAGHRLF